MPLRQVSDFVILFNSVGVGLGLLFGGLSSRAFAQNVAEMWKAAEKDRKLCWAAPDPAARVAQIRVEPDSRDPAQAVTVVTRREFHSTVAVVFSQSRGQGSDGTWEKILLGDLGWLREHTAFYELSVEMTVPPLVNDGGASLLFPYLSVSLVFKRVPFGSPAANAGLEELDRASAHHWTFLYSRDVGGGQLAILPVGLNYTLEKDWNSKWSGSLGLSLDGPGPKFFLPDRVFADEEASETSDAGSRTPRDAIDKQLILKTIEQLNQSRAFAGVGGAFAVNGDLTAALNDRFRIVISGSYNNQLTCRLTKSSLEIGRIFSENALYGQVAFEGGLGRYLDFSIFAGYGYAVNSSGLSRNPYPTSGDPALVLGASITFTKADFDREKRKFGRFFKRGFKSKRRGSRR